MAQCFLFTQIRIKSVSEKGKGVTFVFNFGQFNYRCKYRGKDDYHKIYYHNSRDKNNLTDINNNLI